MLMHARLVAIAVVRMGVTQTVNRVKQRPRGDHGRKREQQVNDQMPATLIFVRSDEKSNGKQCSAGRDHDKNENQQTAQIFLLRSLAYFALRRGPNYQPIKSENHCSERIPTRNGCTPEPKTAARGKEYHDPCEHSQDETSARILTPERSCNAHLAADFLNCEADVAPAAPFVMGSALEVTAASFLFERVCICDEFRESSVHLDIV